MAYNADSYTKLSQVKAMAQQVKVYADGAGGIRKISVNGQEVTVGADKSVNIEFPDGVKSQYKIVDTAPTAETAEDGVQYLVENTAQNCYDIYAKVDGKIVKLGNTTVDLSGYVQKEDGKGLSTNDFTNEDKAKLDGLQAATDAEFAEMMGEVFPAAKA